MNNQGLLISEIIFAVIYLIAGLIVYELVKSKDGELRKIMIAYFCAIIIIYGGAAIYSLYPEKMDINTFRIIVCTPKAITMLWLYRYLRLKTKNP
jgi:uncharacterized membrane protein YeaQ/YmgE (transglycosylase-associated protein family)